MGTFSAAIYEGLTRQGGHLGEVFSAEAAGGSESCRLAKLVLILHVAQQIETSKLAV